MYTAHDALRPHFKVLTRIGYYRIVSETVTPTKLFLHNIYRIIIWILVLATNIQHIIRTIQLLHDIDELNNMLLIVMSMLSLLSKHITFNINERQIINAISVLSDIEFIPKNTYEYYNEVMVAYGTFMRRFLTVYNTGAVACAMLWLAGPYIKFASGEVVHLFAYFPFNINSSPGFQCAIIYLAISFTVQSYGNTTMDSIIPFLYAQAQIQFKILQYSLEHLSVEDKSNKRKGRCLDRMSYEDLLRERFVKCVKQYDRIVW